MNTSVIFEPPHSKRMIPQCTCCQQYGHTKNFCQRIPRCVKCTEFHHTSQCPRTVKDNTVKCINCLESHPANYRGCKIHKELQKKLYPKLRAKNTANHYTQQFANPGITYAQMNARQQQQLANNPNLPNATVNPQQSNDISELKTMMKDLITQMGTIMNLITILVNK